MSEKRVKKAYERKRVVTNVTEISPDGKTRCVQSEKRHVDINNIVAKAIKTGTLPVLMGRQHLETIPTDQSYQEALEKVTRANQAFEQLPSKIREKFHNDPRKMLQALEQSADNPQLKVELQNIGLLETSLAEQNSPEGASGGEATADNPPPNA